MKNTSTQRLINRDRLEVGLNLKTINRDLMYDEAKYKLRKDDIADDQAANFIQKLALEYFKDPDDATQAADIVYKRIQEHLCKEAQEKTDEI